MKRKLLLLSVPLLFFAKLSHAQWTPSGSTISTTNNVGIGTTNPQLPLHISLSEPNASGIRIDNPHSGSYLTLLTGGASGYSISNWANSGILESSPASNGGLVLSSYTGNINFQTSNRTDRMSIFNNGTVRIGTGNPGAKLEIYDNTLSKPGGINAATTGVLTLSRAGTLNYAYPEAAEFRIGHGGPSVWGSQVDLFVNGGANTTGIPDKHVMTWQYDGGVGVGTTTPVSADASARTLQIGNQMIMQNVVGNQVLLSNNAYYNGAGWYSTNSDKSSGLRMYDGGFDVYTAGANNPGNNISSQWTSKLSVTNVGNVGIGTTTPTRLFSLKDPSTNTYMSYMNGNNEKWAVGNEGTVNDRFIIYGGSTPSYKLAILNNGNVGIGTATPGAALDVGGVIQISAQNTTTPPNDLGYGLFPYGGVGLGLFSAATQGNQGIGIWTNPNGNKTEVMRITTGGNVGIGTVNPDQKLSVSGTIHAQAVKVDMTGWSDYVFKPQYHLNTLAETKAYIDKNHHLPDMPSEQEVVKNGVDLGEMNKMLLKKVEELTLHLIEQDARVKKLEFSKRSFRN